jgi:hypothetical protein
MLLEVVDGGFAYHAICFSSFNSRHTSDYVDAHLSAHILMAENKSQKTENMPKTFMCGCSTVRVKEKSPLAHCHSTQQNRCFLLTTI